MSRIGVVALALAVLGAACSGDDDAQPTTTTPPTATTVAVTASTAPATTPAPTTPPSTTATPTTTQSVDELKAEIEAAYRDLDAKGFALLEDPSLDGLDAKVAEIAIPGSPYAQAIVTRVTQLVNNGQYLRPNFNSIEKLTIESTEITGPDAATVTACQVSNALTVKRADQSPIPGRSIPVGGTGDLYAARLTESLVRTPGGWRHDSISGLDAPSWKGVDTCPPA